MEQLAAAQKEMDRRKKALGRERLRKIEAAKRAGKYYIEYEVEGRISGASLTYENEESGTEQHEVSTPWIKSFTARKGQFFYISAQNKGTYGKVRVSIHVDGIEVKKSISSGDYGIASASGRL